LLIVTFLDNTASCLWGTPRKPYRGYLRDSIGITPRPRQQPRSRAADRLADLKVQQANVDAQRARVTAEARPALYLAKLFASNDTEAVVRLITALLCSIAHGNLFPHGE
jgi:hypothetical protein